MSNIELLVSHILREIMLSLPSEYQCLLFPHVAVLARGGHPLSSLLVVVSIWAEIRKRIGVAQSLHHVHARFMHVTMLPGDVAMLSCPSGAEWSSDGRIAGRSDTNDEQEKSGHLYNFDPAPHLHARLSTRTLSPSLYPYPYPYTPTRYGACS
ncbi:hypothetical protein K438DRAFT_1993580 [Mycena galopus ATCC 62051]|nr:hypothetical protein K438DRAFT_1993580 [Mycena galopus ATCC 62051]